MSVTSVLLGTAENAVRKSAQAALYSPQVHTRISDTQRTAASERNRAIGNRLCGKCNKT